MQTGNKSKLVEGRVFRIIKGDEEIAAEAVYVQHRPDGGYYFATRESPKSRGYRIFIDDAVLMRSIVTDGLVEVPSDVGIEKNPLFDEDLNEEGDLECVRLFEEAGL